MINKDENGIVSVAKKEEFIEKATSPRAQNLWASFLRDPNNVSSVDCKRAVEVALAKITNPYLQNERVKNIFGKGIGEGNREELERAVMNAESNDTTLRNYSKTLHYSSYPMLKKNRVYSDILTYHHYSVPVSSESVATFEKDNTIISSWNDCFNPKYQFRRIASQVAIEGKCAYFYRQLISTTKTSNPIYYARGEREVKAAFLEKLPNEWWKIVGFTDTNYYRVAFNFMYFLQPGVSICGFDQFFIDTYDKLLKGLVEVEDDSLVLKNKKVKLKSNYIKIGSKNYKIKDNANLEGRLICTESQWFYWVDLPADRCFVFSEQESTPIVAPSSLGVFLEAKDLDSYSLLQQQLSSLPLNSMVVGEIPFQENNLSGNTINDFKIDSDAMIFFNDLFNEISPNGTGVQGLPYKNLKFIQFEGVTNSSDIYLKAVQQFLIATGMGSLFTLTDKPNAIQVKTAQTIEARYSDFLYEQFSNFVNTVYKMHLKLDGKWKFYIFGDVFSDDTTLKNLKEGLSLGQSYLLPKYMAMQNNDIRQANCTMDYINGLGIYEKFKVMQTSYTVSNEGQGRPQADLGETTSDNTVSSIDSGVNDEELR